MKLPLEVLIVRHGESEINLADRSARDNNHSYHELPGFFDRHDSMFRLTDTGRTQASAAGQWIRDNVSEQFDQYYTSDYIRCKETAALLNLPNAQWHSEILLREQSVGHFMEYSLKERQEKFPQEFSRFSIDGLYWTPPGGESMATVYGRVHQVWQEICEAHQDKRVIIVAHGGILKAFRVLLERMSPTDIIAQGATHPLNTERHHNTQILQYSRHDPKDNSICNDFRWRRSVCPWDLSLSSNEWTPMTSPTYSNEDLLKEVEQITRLAAE